MKVLALLSDCPWPPNTGSRVRNAFIWPALRGLGVEVKLLALDHGGTPGPGPLPVELHPFDAESWPRRVLHVLRYSYHQWPASSVLRRRARELAADWKPDVVHAEELRMAAYLPDRARFAPGALRSLTLHNVESDLLRHTGSTALRHGRAAIEALHLAELRSYEGRSARAVDLAFAYSAADLVRYRELYPDARWAETRNGTHASAIQPPPQPAAPGVLLVGSLGYAPNVHGLYWFLDEVLPRLPRGMPVTVAGSRAPEEVRRRLAAAPVRFVDSPPDLAPLYAENAVAVVPVFSGSGTRGKILEALAYERAVVTTTPGAGGLELAEGEGYVLADDAERFAAEVTRLAAAPGERAALARRGRAAVLERYDWAAVAADLLGAWTTARAGRGPRAGRGA